MKAKSILWVMLPVVAALMLTACSSSDDTVTNLPVQPQPGVKKIPYTITVGSINPTTRATVVDDPTDAQNYLSTLKFAAGDRLYVYGKDNNGTLEGYLNMDGQVSADGTSAKFSTDALTYTGSGMPSDNMLLTVTLRGTAQSDNIWTKDNNGNVSINYGTEICVDELNTDNEVVTSGISQAVAKYSFLQGQKTYADQSDLYLYQNTAFFNFTIALEDGTALGAREDLKVENVGGETRVGSVLTTLENNDVVAKFVVPLAATGNALSNIAVTLFDNVPLKFSTKSGETLKGKVYNARKTLSYETLGVAPEAVDMGLPSGVKWANMNIGASKVEGKGLFFAWAETKGYTNNTNDKRTFNWASFKYCRGTDTSLTKYNQFSEYGDVDELTALEASDDAATVNWGSSWRMPTINDIDELINNTNMQKVENYNNTGVTGYLITNKNDATKFIFIPGSGFRGESSGGGDTGEVGNQGCGYYWVANNIAEYPTSGRSFGLGFPFKDEFSWTHYLRCTGFTIRPVQDNN